MSDPFRPKAEELLFLPLGGAGEIGMNLNLYGHDGKWLMLDLGVTFGDSSQPGVEVVMPDPAFIADRAGDLVGLVLTHAHEDHIGAVPYLWPRLRCPIFATPFTAAVLRRKLAEAGLAEAAPIEILPMSGRRRIGPFEIELITLTHSIPEPNAVIVRTRLGNVLHTGDWKLDETPLIGPTADVAALRRLGEEGALAMVCDSTNVFIEGQSGSEAEVKEALAGIVHGLENRIAITCFASNVARLDSIARIAAAADRHCALIGRSLWRMAEAARETGYLRNLPDFVGERDAGFLPRRNVLMICTGSQGEPRSALSRIARREHPQVALEAGDAVIFSSREIPGNEREIAALHNDLARLGVEVITDRQAPVHVSGHPAREELVAMYQWVRPRIALPVHGEARHIREHAALARQCQVPETLEPADGELIRLAPGRAERVASVPFGRIGLDGNRLIALDGDIRRQRRRLADNGLVLVSLAARPDGALATTPGVSLEGLEEPESGSALAMEIAEALTASLAGKPLEALQEEARLAVRRFLRERTGKKPVVKVHLLTVPRAEELRAAHRGRDR